jgi:hypothetical protein
MSMGLATKEQFKAAVNCEDEFKEIFAGNFDALYEEYEGMVGAGLEDDPASYQILAHENEVHVVGKLMAFLPDDPEALGNPDWNLN